VHVERTGIQQTARIQRQDVDVFERIGLPPALSDDSRRGGEQGRSSPGEGEEGAYLFQPPLQRVAAHHNRQLGQAVPLEAAPRLLSGPIASGMHQAVQPGLRRRQFRRKLLEPCLAGDVGLAAQQHNARGGLDVAQQPQGKRQVADVVDRHATLVPVGAELEARGQAPEEGVADDGGEAGESACGDGGVGFVGEGCDGGEGREVQGREGVFGSGEGREEGEKLGRVGVGGGCVADGEEEGVGWVCSEEMTDGGEGEGGVCAREEDGAHVFILFCAPACFTGCVGAPSLRDLEVTFLSVVIVLGLNRRQPSHHRVTYYHLQHSMWRSSMSIKQYRIKRRGSAASYLFSLHATTYSTNHTRRIQIYSTSVGKTAQPFMPAGRI